MRSLEKQKGNIPAKFFVILGLLISCSTSFAYQTPPTHIWAKNVFEFIRYTIDDSSAVLVITGLELYNILIETDSLPNLEIRYYNRMSPSADSAYLEFDKEAGKIILGYGMCNFPGWNSDSSYVFGYLERYFPSPPENDEYAVRCARAFLYSKQDYSFINDPDMPRYMLANFSSSILNTMSPLLEKHHQLADSLVSFFIDNGYYKNLPIFCLFLVISESKDSLGLLSREEQQKLLDAAKEWIEKHPDAWGIDTIKQVYNRAMEEFSKPEENPKEKSHSTTHGSESE